MSTSAATFVKEDCSSPISIPAHWKILGEIVFPESHPSSIQKYATGRVLATVEFPETRPNRHPPASRNLIFRRVTAS